MSLNLSSQVAAANALPYAPSPFSQGLTQLDYALMTKQHGEPVRWWKGVATNAVTAIAGRQFIEQSLSDDVKVHIYHNHREVESQAWGLIRVGQLMMATIPSEIDAAPKDRFLLVTRPYYAQIKLNANAVNGPLPHLYIHSIDVILDASGVVVDAESYTLDGRAIEWEGSAPNGEITVKYRYLPQFEVRGGNDQTAPLGEDGGRLPHHFPLDLLPTGDENL